MQRLAERWWFTKVLLPRQVMRLTPSGLMCASTQVALCLTEVASVGQELGVGKRAKTDRIGTQLIARYIAHEHIQLLPYQPPTIEQSRIDQLLKRRTQAVRSTLRQSFKDLSGFNIELATVLAKTRILHLPRLTKTIESLAMSVSRRS
ncbi:MAG: hypothetical protein M3461_16520 [Pseudomonadota bacterium]|nr:hypothetical protein [Pseudomonadota bacterium]